MGMMALAFILSVIIGKQTIVDIFWGLGYVLIAWVTLIKTGLYAPQHILITSLVTLWGLRLAGYLGYRSWKKGEDARYKELSKSWGSRFYVESFFKVFMMQGILLWLVSLSIIAVNSDTQTHSWSTYIMPTLLWLVGFTFEIVGDWQLHTFLSQPSNAGTTIKTGLWKYTRHPNYFGELLMWWSLWLMAPFGVALLSPLTITAILTLMIPVTESQVANNSDFEAYKKRTSALIPWLPRD